MGSGKSLALKLLYFCEQIFHQTVLLEATINKELFSKEGFFKKIQNNFTGIFISKDPEFDFSKTKIIFKYSYIDDAAQQPLFEQTDDREFDLLAEWSREKKQLQWSSKYIEARLGKWADKIKNPMEREEKKDEIKRLPFPELSVQDVSAYMIGDDGMVKSMINRDGDDFYLYSEVIEQISQEITGDTDKLYNLNNEIKESLQRI
jgi:hypothetical protein